MLSRRFPLGILAFRRSFPASALISRTLFGARLSNGNISKFSSSSDFEPKKTLPPSYEEIQTKLQDLVSNNKVVLFMKGSPTSPQCGFSRQVVQILAEEGLSDYIYVDVLKSEAIRESVKKFSDWPTIPQLYVDGTFVGGCDITKEMHKSGELKDLLGKNQ